MADETSAPFLQYLVVMGASYGGLNAVQAILSLIPAGYPFPILVVQHRAAGSDGLADLLQMSTPVPVVDVLDKQPAVPGVFLAPPLYHVIVEDGYFALSLDEPVNYSRPSVDLAFESAAATYGERTVGIVLSGSNADGSAGLRKIRLARGRAIVQDPGSAPGRKMPQSALRAVPDAEVLSLEEIGDTLASLSEAS